MSDLLKAYRRALLALLLIIGSPAAYAGAIEESWYEVFFNGEKIAFEHHTLEKTRFRGVAVFKLLQASEGRIAIEGRESIVRTSTVSYFDYRMNPLYAKMVTHEKAQTITREVTVEQGVITFRKQLGEAVTIQKIPYREGYTFGVNELMLLYRGLRRGNSYTVKTIDEEKCSIIEEKVKILREEPFLTPRGKVSTFLVMVESSAVPGIPIFINIDSRGKIWQSKTMSLLSRRTDGKKARAFGRTSGYSNRIYVHQKLPVTQDLAGMVLSLSLKDENPGSILENSAYQTVRRKGKELEVTLHATTAPSHLQEVPPGEKRMAMYLAPSIRIESRDPGIMSKARSIVGSQEDPMQRIRMLCSWIYHTLAKDDSGIALLSARETLREGRGDCTEHAVLFCAFARALGIPSRQACGLIFTGDSFGFHAWAEAWCGRWVPVDATVDRVGLPAAYILLGTDAEGQPGVKSNVKLVRMLRGTSIAIHTATRGGETYSMEDPSTLVTLEGSRLINRVWETSMEKPEGWNWKCYHAERIVLDGPGGSRVTIFPLFIMTKGDQARLADEIRQILNKEGISPVFGNAQGRALGSYGIVETPFTFTRDGGAWSGSTVMLSGADRRILFLLFYTPSSMQEKNADDFERILESISL